MFALIYVPLLLLVIHSLVMAPVHVNHPDFINFTEKMEIGPAAKQEIGIYPIYLFFC